jgi:hypothetical protein
MDESTKEDLTFGLAITGGVIGIAGIIVLIIAIFYIFVNKNIFSSFIGFISNLFKSFFINNESLTKSDICSIVPSNTAVPRIPSLFVAHLAFFFGFLLANAIYILEYKNDDTAGLENYVNNRKNRASTSIALLIVVFLFILIVRYNTTNCESMSGMLFTSLIFGGLGNLWFMIGDICGLKYTDIFGVSQSIIASKSTKSPIVCATSTSA